MVDRGSGLVAAALALHGLSAPPRNAGTWMVGVGSDEPRLARTLSLNTVFDMVVGEVAWSGRSLLSTHTGDPPGTARV